MPSLKLFAVEGSAGEGASGNWTIPLGTCSPDLTLSSKHTTTIAGKTFTYWSSVTGTNSVISGYMNATDIPTGWYWMHDPESGYQIKFGCRATGQITFGPMKYAGSTVGSGTSTGGSDVDDRVLVLVNRTTADGTVYYLCRGQLSSTTGGGEVRGYGLSYAVTFDGIDSLISGDSPYEPPDGQAGSDSAAGGGGAGGAGYPTGINTDTPDNKKNRAGVGCDIYLCSPIAVKAFTKMLWGSTNTGFIDAFFKRVQNSVYNPVDSIITCHSLPSAFAPTGGTQATGIKAGGVDFSTYDGTCVGQIVTNEWVHSGPYTYSCEECWGNYSDYRDTKVSLYLPFCGIVPLDTSLFLSYKGELRVGITIDYWCNILNGNCAAFVKTQDRFGDTKLIKVATGNCAQPCPISGNDRGMQQKLGSLFGFGQSILSAASGGSPIQIMAGVASGALGVEQAFFTAPHHTDVVGSLNGAAGFAAATDIQIIFDIPIPMESENYSMCRGRPSEVSRSVGEYTGHCELEIHADSVNYATDEEKREIERICLNGILI